MRTGEFMWDEGTTEDGGRLLTCETEDGYEATCVLWGLKWGTVVEYPGGRMDFGVVEFLNVAQATCENAIRFHRQRPIPEPDKEPK